MSEEQEHHRHSHRLRGASYGMAGAYFLTLCSHDRLPLFSSITGDGLVCLSDIGKIIDEVWQSRFYDRILRDDRELYNARMYTRNNPLQWVDDEYNPNKKR